MAFMQCSFSSDSLGRAVGMNVILPQKSSTQIGIPSSGSAGRRYPVLYLLHGMSDNYTTWSRRSSIERYVAGMDLIVVMPDGLRSFYRNMAHGQKFHDFLADELPKIVAGFFPVSDRREDTYIAGLSMGGYGALAMGLEYPERYSHVGAFSSVADISRFALEMNPSEDWRMEMINIFGDLDKLAGSKNDLFKLATENAGKIKPEIYLSCGTEDPFYADNQALLALLEKQQYKISSHFCKGFHNWDLWDAEIQEFLKTLPR